MTTAARNRFHAWRIAHGLSQQEVADLTGYTKTMVGRYERGEASFSPLSRVHIARALGVPVSVIFEAPDETVK